MNYSKNFIRLSELKSAFRSGFIIIDSTLFEIEKKVVVNEWRLISNNLPDMVAEARETAEISNRKRIVVDDEHVYDEDTVCNESELVTFAELYRRMDKEEIDDVDSFIEYFSD